MTLSTRRTRLLLGAVCTALFVALYWFSNRTVLGQTLENSSRWARTYDTGATVGWLLDHVDVPPFSYATPTIALGIAAILAIGAIRRDWRGLATAAIATPATIAAGQLFKDVAGRPDLVKSLDTAVSYPSGHAGIALTLTAGLLVVLPRRVVPWAAPVLMGWSALVAAGLQAEG